MDMFFASIMNSIRQYFRDATPVIMQVIGPIVMIIILASIMQGSFKQSKNNL